jgi:hypothetical protein
MGRGLDTPIIVILIGGAWNGFRARNVALCRAGRVLSLRGDVPNPESTLLLFWARHHEVSATQS